jgi:hypothetical protein
MKSLVAIVLMLAGLIHAMGEPVATEKQPVRSRTGQFLAMAAPPDAAAPPKFLVTGKKMLSLEPALLVVSCERIKQVLWRDLDATAPWEGKVFLSLHHARSGDDPVTIVAEKGRNAWSYRVDLPDTLEQTRFLRAIVNVLLLEMANRNSASRSAEIPLWLAEGLAQEMMMSEGIEFILPPPNNTENGLNVTYMMASSVRSNSYSLAQAQQVLRSHPPLTFDQLSWPENDRAWGEPSDTFGSSAQLFVNQLLHLKEGPACMRAMLEDLPQRYNWQFAFLTGFRPHFTSLLEVEKWWALQLVQFSGRDLRDTWTHEESWKKLDEIIRSQVEVRSSQADMPLRAQVSLQTIIQQWDTLQQTPVLQRKVQELGMLRVHVAQDYVGLVDDYRQVLGIYLQKRNANGAILPFVKHTPSKIAEETAHQLDVLDAQREALRPTPPVATTGSGEGPVIVP